MSVATTRQGVLWTPYLRPSPIAAEAALRVLSVGELDASTLALVIGSDAGLTAALIRATEPADMHVSIASRIAGLAPARLHSALFPALVDALATHHESYTDSDNESWRMTLATAIAAETVADARGDVPVNAAYLAGLFHNAAVIPPDDGAATAHLGNVRAMARRYRFPAWLIECVENQDLYAAAHGASSALDEVLSAAKSIAADLVRVESAITPLPESVRDFGLDTALLGAARERAARSLEGRMSLFAFTPAPPHELRASLLRFSNHLLLYWRVDETNATTLRARVGHLDALVQFASASSAAQPLEDILITCADRMRAALSIRAGLVAAWPESGSPVCGVRWSTPTGTIDLVRIEASEAHCERSIQRLAEPDVWPLASNDTAAPNVLSIHTPRRRHAGYIVIANDGAHSDAHAGHLREWAAALGRAAEHHDNTVRDDERHAAFRNTIRELSAPPGAAPDGSDPVGNRQRHISRAAIAALHAPLSAVTAQAHQLVSQSTDHGTQELVKELAKHTRNAARVMADLRAIAGGGNPPNEFILVNAPVRQYLHAIRARLERRSIRLEEHLAEGLPRIRADVRELAHLFANLFAFIEQRMGHTGRTIIVKTAPSADRASVIVTIEMKGVALTASQAETLFDPLTDRERASTDFALSLAACRSIVDVAGGSLTAASTEDGAVFTIAFNAIHAVLAVERDVAPDERGIVSFAPSDTVESPQPESGAARVLIVDDDEVMRDLMKQALVRKGYLVQTAKDGVEATRTLNGASIDLVLLDLLMPNRDGLAVLRELRDRHSPPATIVMTGSRSTEMREEAMALGAHSFLQKPFELGQLLAEVESVLVHQRA